MSTSALALDDFDFPAEKPEDLTEWAAHVRRLIKERIPDLLAEGADPAEIARRVDQLLLQMALIEIRFAVQLGKAEERYREFMRSALSSENRLEAMEVMMKRLPEALEIRDSGRREFEGFRQSRRELTAIRQTNPFPAYAIGQHGDNGGVIFNVELMSVGEPYVVDIGEVTFVAVRLEQGGIDLFHLPDPFGGEPEQ